MYRFDEFELDINQFELRRAGQPVHVEPRALELVCLLVESRDRLSTAMRLSRNSGTGARCRMRQFHLSEKCAPGRRRRREIPGIDQDGAWPRVSICRSGSR